MFDKAAWQCRSGGCGGGLDWKQETRWTGAIGLSHPSGGEVGRRVMSGGRIVRTGPDQPWLITEGAGVHGLLDCGTVRGRLQVK